MFAIDPLSLLLGFLIAALLFVLLWLWLRATWQGQQRDLAGKLEFQAQNLQQANSELERQRQESAGQAAELHKVQAIANELERELKVEQTRHQERVTALQEAEQRLSESFSHLSRNALKENTASFLDIASENMKRQQELAGKDMEARRKAVDDLVAPMAQTMKKLEEQLLQVDLRGQRDGATLLAQLQQATQAQQDLSRETDRLRQALRQPTVRGQWGEMQLKRVAELAGMLEHVDFDTQRTIKEEGGGRRRPDMVINMPGGKSIAVDAKAVMDAYLEAAECDDETQRLVQLARHARQVRDHITALSSRAYWNSLENSPEFVVMFLPGEAFYSAALQADPALLEFGSEQRVLLAGPTTLLALLKAVSYGWQQEVIADNARKVAETGQLLYDRLVPFAGHFVALRKSLQGAVDSYNKVVGSFERNVLSSARRLSELGVQEKKELPTPDSLDSDLRRPRENLDEDEQPKLD